MSALKSEGESGALREGAARKELAAEGVAPRRTQKQMVWRHLRGNLGAMIGIGLLVGLGVTALFAWQLMPADPYELNGTLRRDGPNTDAWLGRDELGRDILSRIILGTRIAFSVAFVAVAVGLVAGSFVGTLAGYIGGKIDTAISVMIDLMLAFPTLLLAIIIVAALGPGLINTAIAIGVSAIPVFARIARGSALSVSRYDYVEAARAIGASPHRLVAYHVLPNMVSPIIVIATIMLARAILSEASLSFLGLGAQPPEPSWGSMASTGRAFLQSEPHIVLVPAAAIMLTVLAFNLFGDGLRDALDPRMRTSGGE